MGGGGSNWAETHGPSYPYPKWVWSPTGGWWADPKYWRKNAMGITMWVLVPASLCAAYYSSLYEESHRPPQRWTLSMLYAKQYQEGGKWYEEAKKFK